MYILVLKLEKNLLGVRKHYFSLLNGQKHGYESICDENNNIIRTTNWFLNLKHGLEIDYDSDGSLVKITSYGYGLLDGIVLEYGNGKLFKRSVWRFGEKMCEETYSPDTKFLTEYVDYEYKKCTLYDIDGSVKKKYAFNKHEFDIVV